MTLSRPRLVTRPLLLVFTADFCGLTAFYLLLSVVPQYAGSGLTTGALMLSTVAAEFAMPWLTARLGERSVLAGGLVLLGVPALALPVATTLPVITVVCLLRGAGLAVVFVVCGTVCARLIPAERRGEGLGAIGVVAGLPAIVMMPFGVWLAGVAGYGAVFVLSALVVLPGLAAVAALPRTGAVPASGMAAAVRTGALVRPALVFAATATAAGVVVTFLPGMPGAAGRPDLAAAALLAHSLSATACRWWAGRYGDRRGAARPLAYGVAVGVLALVPLAAGHPVGLLAGAVLGGAGFGMVQAGSLAVMYERAPVSAYGVVTAVWSVAYDGGLGIGSAGFGMLAAVAGPRSAFAVLAVVMLLALANNRQSPRRPRPWPTLRRHVDRVGRSGA